jgi:hypothetical protein
MNDNDERIEIQYDVSPDEDEFIDVGEETVLKVGRSMLDDIDDRINAEFGAELFGGVTARSSHDELGRRQFRTIPEE